MSPSHAKAYVKRRKSICPTLVPYIALSGMPLKFKNGMVHHDGGFAIFTWYVMLISCSFRAWYLWIHGCICYNLLASPLLWYDVCPGQSTLVRKHHPPFFVSRKNQPIEKITHNCWIFQITTAYWSVGILSIDPTFYIKSMNHLELSKGEVKIYPDSTGKMNWQFSRLTLTP